MLLAGTSHNLNIFKLGPNGYELKNDEGFSAYLPENELPKGLKTGDSLDVFLFESGNHLLMATTAEPTIHLNEFGYLQVKDVNSSGAFLDWGISKDILVPYSEQRSSMKIGKSYIVYCYLDDKSGRVVASTKTDKFLVQDRVDLTERQKVNILVGDETDLGYSVIINNLYKGLIYHNDLFQPIQTGEHYQAYVKQIREDFKVDITLQKPGYGHVDPVAREILRLLANNNGYLPYHDKTDSEEIVRHLKMSKKTFKKAIGLLFRERKITIETNGIRLN